MLVSISARLSEPPSEVTCFRDITLYSSCILGHTNLLECEKDLKDIYWRWLKKAGAWDFVDDIIERYEENTLSIRRKRANIVTPSIRCENLNTILAALKGYSDLQPPQNFSGW